MIEANPRASRTVPFVSKATGRAARQGRGPGDGRRDARPSCATRGCCARRPSGGHVAVKEAVLPFDRFPDVDTVLGPEMRSTGEVMGIDRSFGLAFAKSQAAAGQPAARRRARCSSRSPTATRPPGMRRGAPLRRARVRARGDRRYRRRARGRGPAGRRRSWPSWARATAAPTRSTSSRRARSTSS